MSVRKGGTGGIRVSLGAAEVAAVAMRSIAEQFSELPGEVEIDLSMPEIAAVAQRALVERLLGSVGPFSVIWQQIQAELERPGPGIARIESNAGEDLLFTRLFGRIGDEMKRARLAA